ncbi:MAG: class I SAM-dependent DNA methyltransferase [Solirubrobacteraceae bacterium]
MATVVAVTSDAILVAEDWISEHYFTTDAKKESFTARVLARRKEWDAGKEDGTPRTRLVAARQELLSTFATLSNDTEASVTSELNERLVAILGYGAVGYAVERQGPVRFIRSGGIEEPGLVIVDARATAALEDLLAKDADNLTTPFVIDEKSEVTSVARLLSRLFVSDGSRPAFVLVLAGARTLVAERERWPEGRYLTVDLQLVLERGDDRRGGEVDRALTCLAAESLAPNAEGDIWWAATLEESVRHTVGVSKDLREGVRLSIEIIANEVVRRRADQGLGPLPAGEAQPLAKQALRFLYRILFLLYAEASPELGVLPKGTPEYEQGYSLDRLRDLTLVELSTPQARDGRHLYESLAVLFRLVDEGHDPSARGAGDVDVVDGLTFRSLRADLFRPEATAFIDEVGLGNLALQSVLRHLLLSKPSSGRGIGFISYAELGINQLGAVYEGLMSYTGFFAETDLYEVAKDGNSEKGSWVVPVERAEGIAAKDFVRSTDPVTGEEKAVLHERGSFVFRLAGRERQQSASYYTPEVLTRFVVSQALEELLDQDDQTTTAAEILELTICEPALGSGAFAIEAVRQLAEAYLKRRQDELGATIDPDDYPRELQQVKAYLALHQTYGVDLNATAVELAEISLWLDTMVEGLQAPWFGLHLRRGNSLIGSRKAVFPRGQVADRSWLKAVPARVDDGEDEVPEIAGRIPHFLLPAEGWGAAAEVGKEIKELSPDAVFALKAWRRSVRAKPARKQIEQLVDMGHRVQRLWEIATHRLRIADTEIRREIPVWGRPETILAASPGGAGRHVSREEIEASLADPDGAYQRLRRIMDAWCALWFWPLTEDEVRPPIAEQWQDAHAMILGRHAHKGDKQGQQTFSAAVGWDALQALEDNDRAFAGAAMMEAVLQAHPWLAVCERIAKQQGFFHWELDFAPVFARGGFDLQVGNPPWVRPRADSDALLAEGDPWWQLAVKPTPREKAVRRLETLRLPGMRELVIDGTAEVVVIAETLGAPSLFPRLQGLQPNLYRCFMERMWGTQSLRGVTALVHPETHFTDNKAGVLRAATYRHLRRHWQFINEIKLFEEIHDHQSYGVHVYGAAMDEPCFYMATSLYHPETVVRSFAHDGSGVEPGLKDPEGNWDVRPHSNRILKVDVGMLQTWHDLLESADLPVLHSRMVYTVNRASADVLAVLAQKPRIAALGLEFSAGWHESGDRAKGFFETDWGIPASWAEVILQGPHLYVGVPFYKAPNESMAHQLDWSPVDLETLAADAIPVTSYKPRGDGTAYKSAYTHWGPDKSVAARDHYRVAWRRMADSSNERTLISAIVPPGTAHIDGVSSVGFAAGRRRDLALVQGFVGSIVSDFLIRAVPKGDIRRNSFERLAIAGSSHSLMPGVELRALRLNCLTDAYAGLWNDALAGVTINDAWTGGIDYPGRPQLEGAATGWTPETPLRRASDRRQALVELDALVGLTLGLSVDELCTIYRTQFPVLYGYDHNTYFYDANGRLVPNLVLTVWRKKGDDWITEDERTATNASANTYVYELPFVNLDREADMRTAYAEFERRLAERTDG